MAAGLRIVRALRMGADTIAAAVLLLGWVVGLVIRDSFGPRVSKTGPPRLLLVETGATLHVQRSRGLESTITAADLDGFFEHVTVVHPLVGADPSEPAENALGPVRIIPHDASHEVVEAPVGRFHALRAWPRVNFVLAQAGLVRRLHALVRRRGLNVVRVGDPYYQGLLGLTLRRRNRVPLVVRIGGNDDATFKALGRRAYPRLFPSRGAERWVAHRVLPRAEAVAGANQNNLEFAIRNGARRERSVLFRYGTSIHPVHFVEPASRPHAPHVRRDVGLAGQRLLLFVGRLEPVKHPADLVEVLALVRSNLEDVGLVLVGDGSERSAIERKVQERGLANHVALVGNKDQEWIASLLVSASVIVSPHMGRALAECALAGVPLVAYDLDWQSEFVRDGENGFLVRPRDAAAMAEAVVRLLNDPALAKRLGDAARETALSMMDPARLVTIERATYERLLSA